MSSYEELNALLLDRCVAYAKAHKHPEITDQTIWQVFEAERARLVQIIGRFDGFHAVTAAVSKTVDAMRRRFASTTTSTRWHRAPSAGRSRSRPTLIGSSFAKTGRSSASMRAASAAADAS